MNFAATIEQYTKEQLVQLLIHQQAMNAKLTHELAILKRQKFAATSEAYTGEQQRELFETLDIDLAAVTAEIEQLALAHPAPAEPTKQQPKRIRLPAELPRTDIHHEPDSTLCRCGCQMKRIGEDVSEKLDYQPGVFTVERHVRGKWVCNKCEALVQAPVPAQIIDKGIPTSGLLAQVIVAKYADHLPLYRQTGIFERAGLAIPDSTLAEWVGRCGVALQPLVDALKEDLLAHPVLHADETPLPMLKPGNGKTHKAYLWSYCSTPLSNTKAVVFDFAESRGGKHAEQFLDRWRGTLVCDDFPGYKVLFRSGITEAGCMAHARRRFHELWANHSSQIAGEALDLFNRLYAVEREANLLEAGQRLAMRQAQAKPVADALHQWLLVQRQRVPDGSATCKAIEYSLNRWPALIHYLNDPQVPIDNNWVENQIRPIALGRNYAELRIMLSFAPRTQIPCSVMRTLYCT
jgi:transposase